MRNNPALPPTQADARARLVDTRPVFSLRLRYVGPGAMIAHRLRALLKQAAQYDFTCIDAQEEKQTDSFAKNRGDAISNGAAP